MRLQENTTFANRYQLERLLGRGGFSEVWLAKDSYTHLSVAIKVYAPGQGMDANGLQEFSSELANVFDLNHTNLLKPTHVDAWNDMPYLIMAYCSQGSITKKIGKMPEEEIWKLIHDVASGLAYLHRRGVVHQDIKPDNILLDEFGNYVITDFGISTRARSTLRKSVVGGAVSGGTMAYMGPERFSRQSAPTNASDIWSLGSMIYEIVDGNVPFGELGGGIQHGGGEIPYITANVSDALKYTIYMMLSKETWDRPTAETLVQWSQNPQAIRIDNNLLNGGKDQPSSPPSRKTQRFSPSKKEPVKQKDDDSWFKKHKEWIWLIIAPAFLIMLIGLGTIGNRATERAKAIRLEKERVLSNHTFAVSNFDQCLNAADIDHINALFKVYDYLQDIRSIESGSYFEGTPCYFEKRQNLKIKVEELYEIADRKYQRAPAGTETEKRNLEKRNQIESIKQKL